MSSNEMLSNEPLKFHAKTAYGIKRYFPINERAESLCTLLRYKSIRDKELQILRDLGLNISIEA